MEIDTSGADAFVEALRKLDKNINKSVKPFLERCAELATEEAREGFEYAMYDGDNDVTVSSSIEDKSATISAVGEAVTFIEFGTGVVYTAPEHPEASQLGFTRGGYGHHRGKNPKGWSYRGSAGTNGEPSRSVPGLVHTFGNPANMCMYLAREKVLEEGEEIFKEVYNND